MKCNKCETEVKADSKFCPECGIKVESYDDEELSVEKTCDAVADCWFMLGANYGACYVKKDEEGIKEMGEKLRSIDEGVYSAYRQRVLRANKRIGKKDVN